MNAKQQINQALQLVSENMKNIEPKFGASRTLVIILASCAILFLSACEGKWWDHVPGYGGYWWQRGQPKSVTQLLDGSQAKLNAALDSFKSTRPEIAPIVKDLQGSLLKVKGQLAAKPQQANVAAELVKSEELMMGLEGKLSVGSRAAYGELAAQLRSFSDRVNSGQQLNDAAFNSTFGLFTARTLSFLANELSVPAPVV